MAASKYWVLYVGIFVPLFLSVLSIALVLLLQPGKVKPSPPRKCAASSDCQNGGTCTNGVCTCTAQWTGDRCQTLALPPSAAAGATQACGLTPVQCVTDTDCRKCGGTVEFQCTELTGEDNWANLSGKYCLPAKPTDACTVDTGKYDKAIAGVYTWQGWKDVETQKWTCTCEYPRFYEPAIGTANDNAGACVKSQQLCKFGIWHYPCMGKQCNLTPEQQKQLVGTSPLQNGYCQCDNVPCTSGIQCASGECADGVCIHQRTGLDPKTGLPVCVRDTCAPDGKWLPVNEPPFAYGRCQCDASAVDTGFGCTSRQPPPPKFDCPKNCSGKGTCMDTHECLCNPGYTGKDCSTPVCTTPCTGRGACIGPDTCFCAPGTHYNVTTGVCDPLITCLPEPTVDAESGYIRNHDKFSTPDQTSCVQGSRDQLIALCQRSVCLDPSKCNANGSDRWDTVNDDMKYCFKRENCEATACKADYCGTGVTAVVGAISQVPSADRRSCFNPAKEDVALMCERHNDGLDNTSLLYNASTNEYRCMSLQTQQNLTVLDVQLLQGMGITGSFCVSFADATAADSAKVLDGNDLFAYYSIIRTADLSKVIDNSAPSLSEGFLNLKRLTAPTCNGYLYAFNSTFSSDMSQIPVGTPLSLRIDAYPASRWTCRSNVATVSITQCTPAYSSGIQSVTLTPYTPVEGASVALNPQMDPQAAFIIIQSTDAWKGGNGSLSADTQAVVNLKQLQAAGGQALVNTANHDKILQMACTEAYCRTGSNVTAMKLMVLAWKYVDSVNPAELGGSCAFLKAPLYVKYKLIRTSSSVGAPVDLLTPAIQPSVMTLADKSQVAYYIDAVPVDMSRTYTYTLGAYVVPSRDDKTTTYNTAGCRSAVEEVMSVTVDPYNEQFCQQIRAPLADEGQLPPFAWLQNGLCYWRINQLDAIDYYCALHKRSDFDPTNFQLGDGAGKCKTLMPSYPAKISNWSDSTCNPSKPYDSNLKYSCSPILPAVQVKLLFGQKDMLVEGDGVAAVSGQGTLDITLNSHTADGAVKVSLPQNKQPTPPYKYLVCNYILTYLDQSDTSATVVWQATNATLALVPDLAHPEQTLATSFDMLQQSDVGKPRQTVLMVTNVPPNMQFNTDIVFSIALASTSAARISVQQLGFMNQVPSTSAGNQCVQTAYGTMDYETCFKTCNPNLSAARRKKKGKHKKTLGAATSSTPAQCFGSPGKYDTRVCRGWTVKDDPAQMRQVQCDQDIKFEQGQGGLGSEKNFKTRLTNMHEFYTQHHVGDPVKGAEFNVDNMWKSYYYCGPGTDPTSYGFNPSYTCDPLDSTCSDMAAIDGCAYKNVCDPWTYVPTQVTQAQDYQPTYTQTRTCYPSAKYASADGVSQCCDCRGVYSISDTLPRTVQCQCNEGEADCGDVLKV